MKKVLCLYRVSTLGQVDPKDDIPMQRRECEDFIARHSDWVYYGERLEKGVFGYKVSANKRDVILEIRAMAERKEFDVLLVFMFDRLGRREDETPFLMQWFIEHGIEVWSTREGRYEWRHESDNAWIPEGQTKTSVYGATLLAGHSVMRTLPPQVGRQLFLQIAENPLLLPLDLSLLQRLHGCQGVRRSVDLFREEA